MSFYSDENKTSELNLSKDISLRESRRFVTISNKKSVFK
jgi:hypothetical protein